MACVIADNALNLSELWLVISKVVLLILTFQDSVKSKTKSLSVTHTGALGSGGWELEPGLFLLRLCD